MGPFDIKRVWGPEPLYPNVLAAKGSGEFTIIAGPCSIESPEQVEEIASVLTRARVSFMRGGVFRAGTYPRKDFGLQVELLRDFRTIANKYGLKTIIEVLDVRDIASIEPYADAFQVGARHMQDYALLKELGRTTKTVTLKRNMGSTMDEFLGAAEYLCKGSCKPILIERGSSSHMNHVRWDLSISLIAAVKRMTGLPIIVDASHGTGRRDLVEPMTLAGVAAGADGFLVEVHPDPAKSLSDADQAISFNAFWRIKDMAERIRGVVSGE